MSWRALSPPLFRPGTGGRTLLPAPSRSSPSPVWAGVGHVISHLSSLISGLDEAEAEEVGGLVEAAAAGESTPSAAMTAAVAAPTPGSGSYVEVDDEIVVRAPHDAASFAAAAAASAAAAAASAEGDVDEPFLAGKDPEDTPVLPSPAFISRRGPGSAATEAVQLCEEEEAAAPAPRAGRAGELEDG